MVQPSARLKRLISVPFFPPEEILASAFDHGLSESCLRDFARRCRRLAMWEKDRRMQRSSLRRADEYDRLAALQSVAND
jgi:hypothetical protein